MWLKPHGYAVITQPEGDSRVNLDGFQVAETSGGVAEFDTFSCCHCGRIIHVQARQRPEDIGGFCRQCMKPVCPTCVDIGRCDPLEKKLERAEARDRALRSYGL